MLLSIEQKEVIKRFLKSTTIKPSIGIKEKIASVSAFIALYENIAELYLFRSLYYKDNKQFDLAKADYQTAITICPLLEMVYCNLASSYNTCDLYEDSEKCYAQAKKINQDSAFRRIISELQDNELPSFYLEMIEWTSFQPDEADLPIQAFLNRVYNSLNQREWIQRNAAEELAGFAQNTRRAGCFSIFFSNNDYRSISTEEPSTIEIHQKKQ